MGITHVDGLEVAGVPTMGVNPLPLTTDGQYFFVSSTTGSNSFAGTTADAPFATLAYALSSDGGGLMVANRGDTIVIAQGHAEAIIAAGTVTCDIAGVNIIGLGTGADRPEFSFGTATTASLLITAANVQIANIVCISAIDALVNPIHIQAAGCTLGNFTNGPVEWQDPSSSFQAVRAVLTTNAADNLNINLKITGIITGGTSPVNGIRLVGVDDATINCNFYGRASTAWIEFITTLSSNVEIYGYMYNSGVTDFSKDVVNTGGLSATWFASLYDGSYGGSISGGSAAALAGDDVSTVAANMAVPSADATANVLERDVIGNKTDAAQVTVGTTRSLMGYMKGLMNSTQRTIVKSDGAVLTGADPIFTITGGMIKIVSIVGRVTTIIGGVSNGNIEATTTVPAATTAMSTTVAIDNDAAGTIYTFVGPTGVLTPTTAGVVLMDYGSTTLTPTQYIVNAGTINFTGSAAQTGVIEWTMDYLPMTPSVVVAAAA